MSRDDRTLSAGSSPITKSYRCLSDLVCIAEGGISATGPDMVINVYAGIHEM
jgi:hypothetical protein